MSHRFRSVSLAAMILCLFGSLISAQTTSLPYQPVDAQYSKTLDRIVMISASPNQVHSYDPVTNTDTAINLPRAPLSMSVDPDGIHVAVGHDGLVSFVNLLNQTVDRVYQVPLTVNTIALNGSYAYLFTAFGASPGKWLNLTNGAFGDFTSASPTNVLISPLNNVLYINSGPNSAFDISNGVPSAEPQNSASLQGRSVLSPDNSRLYGACPNVYTIPSSASQPLTYLSSLPISSIQSSSDSIAASKIAVIPGSTNYCLGQSSSVSAPDTQIILVDRNSFTAGGTLQLAPFASGSKTYSAHGKYVFFNNSGNRLFAISQADSTATGLASTFEVQSFDLSTPPICAPVLSATSASVSGAGALNSVAVTAPADCAYQVSSAASWLQITSGSYNSGNGTVQYFVRPNTDASSRTADITIGNQKFTVTQDASPSTPPPFSRLGFPVAAADYSKTLDRVVLVASIPNELHIYDPVSGADQIVALPRSGRSVSVSPDGLHAAVGSAGLIFYVNLQTASIEKTAMTPVPVDAIALNSKGIAYYGSLVNNAFGVYSIDLVGGGKSNFANLSGASGVPLRLHPSEMLLYLSSGSVTRYYVADTNLTPAPNPPTLLSGCGNIWISEDGSRYYTTCGQAYSSSLVDPLDGIYLGSIPGLSDPISQRPPRIQWAADSAVLGSTAVIPAAGITATAADSKIILFGDASFNLSGQAALPSVTIGASSFASHGRYAFWSKNADRLIVLSQTDVTSNLLSPWTIDVLSVANNDPGCSFAISPMNATSSGAFGEIAVTAGANCVWTATSSAPWLTLASGGFGIGNGVIDYVAASNPTTSSRSATINVAGQTFTFTQSGAAGTVTLAPSSATVAAGGASGTITVTSSSANYAWTVTSDSAWLSITSGISGTGNGQVKYTAAPTNQITSRTGTISVSGQSFQVTQSGATVALSSSSKTASGGGGQVTVDYTVDSPSLTPRAISNVPWITYISVESPQATGGGKVNLSVTANDSASKRMGIVTIGGQPLQVTQDGATVTLPSPSTNISSAGGKSQVMVLSNSFAITLTPVSSVSWIKLDTSCCLPTSFSFTADPNSSATPRTGTISIGGQTFTVIQAGVASAGLRFVPVTPCRIVDTRNAAGVFGGPSLGALGSRDFPVIASACNLPSTALAFSLNITAVPLGPLGYLTVYPTGQSRPEVSTLNSYDGRVVANAAIVPAGDSGAVSVYATDPTHVIIDVNGYFDTASPGLSFYALHPCRTVDTRTATGVLGGPGLSNSSRDFPLQSSSCQLPASAQAYSLNATAVPSGVLNYLTVWPTGQTQPGVSTLNSYDGSVVANAAIAPAGTNGSVSAFASGTADLLLDVNGVFAPAGSIAGAAALKFYPVAPCRVADTRGATGPLGAPSLSASISRDFPVSGTCGIPSTAQAFALNVTVVPKASSMHFLSLWPAGQTRPEVSTLNSYQGKVLANAAIVPAGSNGAVSAFATEDTELILDVTGYFAP